MNKKVIAALNEAYNALYRAQKLLPISELDNIAVRNEVYLLAKDTIELIQSLRVEE